jgi:hypothetical protein
LVRVDAGSRTLCSFCGVPSFLGQFETRFGTRIALFNAIVNTSMDSPAELKSRCGEIAARVTSNSPLAYFEERQQFLLKTCRRFAISPV